MWTIQTGERQWKENRCVWYEGEVCSQASELGWILTAPKEHRIYLQRCCFITNSFTVSKVHSEMTFWMCCTSQTGLVLMNLVLWCVCKCSHHHITSHSIFFLHAVCIFSETKEDFGMQQADTNKQDFRESNVSSKSQITFSEAWMSLLQDSSINLTCFTSTAVFSHSHKCYAMESLCKRRRLEEVKQPAWNLIYDVAGLRMQTAD